MHAARGLEASVRGCGVIGMSLLAQRHHRHRRLGLYYNGGRARQEIKALAAEARRLRPDVKIFIRPSDGVAYGAATLRSDPRQLELDLGPEPPLAGHR